MADQKNYVKATLGYTGTDFTRAYKFENVPTSALVDVKDVALAINASLAAGTDGGMKDFFRSNDYDASDPQNIIGQLDRIVALQSYTGSEEYIPLN